MNIPDGFKLVHQSGHTDTLCDGTEHRVIGGGWVGMNKPSGFDRSRPYKCDCAMWSERNAAMKEPRWAERNESMEEAK